MCLSYDETITIINKFAPKTSCGTDGIFTVSVRTIKVTF